MSNDNKTLADVQPGGRVRLGDALLPCPFCGEPLTINGAGDGVHQRDSDCILAQYVVVADHAPHAAAWNRRSLSAQPSPGGQDVLAALQQDYDKLLDSFNRQVEVAEKIAGRALQQDDRIEELEEALAARQPVGEPFAYGSSAGHQPIPAHAYGEGCSDVYDIPLYAAPPAQALDLGPSIPSELAPVAAALKRFNECAEDCESDGCDIGRDWFDALTTMGLLKRTQRSPAVWTMTAEGERLLALIDSQAVGNGN